jgi:hypothetical protein
VSVARDQSTYNTVIGSQNSVFQGCDYRRLISGLHQSFIIIFYYKLFKLVVTAEAIAGEAIHMNYNDYSNAIILEHGYLLKAGQRTFP